MLTPGGGLDRYRYHQRETTVEHIRKRPKRYLLSLLIALVLLAAYALKFGGSALDHFDLIQSWWQGLRNSSAQPNHNQSGVASSNVLVGDGRQLVVVPSASFTKSTRQVLRDVATNSRNGFVAVGWHHNGHDKDAAIWWSKDGKNWARVSDGGPGFAGRGDQYLHAVTASGDGFIAGGSDKGEAVAYSSPDGRWWERFRNRSGTFSDGGPQYISGASARGTAVAAVGGRRVGKNLTAAAWFRHGHGRWQRAVINAPTASSNKQTDTPGLMADVVSTRSDFVAVGSFRSSEGGRARPAVWMSRTGREWTPIAASMIDDPTCDRSTCRVDTVMASVAQTGSRLVAVGYAGTGCQRTAASWASDDGGKNWVRSPNIPHDRLSSTTMSSVAAVGDLTVAVGQVTTRTAANDVADGVVDCGRAYAGVWTSIDQGRHWEKKPPKGDGPTGSMAAVNTMGATAVVVGSDASGEKGVAWQLQRS
jgi:hypothetical protein